MSQNQDSDMKNDSWLADLYDEAKQKDKLQADEKSSESGGPKGLEPTRYGDWEKSGRCIDF